MKKKKEILTKEQKNAIRRRRLRRTVTVMTVTVVCVLTLIAGFALYAAFNIDTDMDISQFENVGSDTVTRLYYYDNDGNAVEMENERIYGSAVTIYTPIDSVPKELQHAFVAIEDKRFYSHHGVDWFRTAAAGVNYFLKTRSTFGASTITQQLIKNVTGKDEYKIDRKVQEIFYAIDLESKLDKDEILEFYLNIVNLSQGCYGVGAAAEKYFSKSVDELDLLECTAIAAITQNPSYYDPIRHPENNSYRRDVILTQMLKQGYIGEEQFNECYEKELTLNVSRKNVCVNSWYTDMVIEDVIDGLCSQMGYTKAAASYLVYNGGLKIYTGMDPELQKTVEEYYLDTGNFPSDALEKGRSGMIVMDPYNGNILAVAGAIGEKSANRIQNYATLSKRPSGSSIKPLAVYAPAIEEGIITWASVYDDVPLEFYKKSDGGYTFWPNNASNEFSGLCNIDRAVYESLNTTAVRVLYDLGIDRSYDYLINRFCIKSLIERDRSAAPLALGQQTYGVTLREMTAAYTAFTDHGKTNRSRSYLTVLTSKGQLLLDNPEEETAAVSAGTAAVMTKLLQNVPYHGVSESTVGLREKVEVAAKTGTSQESCDRWFIGYTPYYICGVWYGHDYSESLPPDTADVCPKIWNDIMEKAHEKIIESGNVKAFEIPENVITASFCRDSGKLMTGSCMLDPRGDRSETGWFIDGTQPKSFCRCHINVLYDKVNGGVATESCPLTECVEIGLIQAERSFPCPVTVTDAEFVWRSVPEDVSFCYDEELPFFANSLPSGEYCGISDSNRQFNCGCRKHNSTFLPHIYRTD